MISTKEIKQNKILSYITTYFSILFALTFITLLTMGFGALLGLIIFNFLKKMGSYSINIGENYNNKEFDKEEFELNSTMSKNYAFVQIFCYSITFFSVIFIEGAFTEGIIIVLPIFLMILFNLLHLKFLNKLKRNKNSY